MIRNFKILGLALVAVFAFNAMAASGAMAQTQGHLTSANGQEFTLTGTEIATGVNAFTGPFGITIKCPGSTYTGHKLTWTPHTFLVSGETATTITPKYVNCAEGASPRTVHMNGCDYQIDDSTTTGGVDGTYGITVDIICPAGKSIQITGSICSISIPGQTDVTGFHATNEAGGHIRLHGAATVKAVICGANTNVTQHQDVTISAHDVNQNPVGVSISD